MIITARHSAGRDYFYLAHTGEKIWLALQHHDPFAVFNPVIQCKKIIRLC